jgi:cellulose synthase/poly-beta-1,6-N-acetylglucosamine synthase-like glycosyltransferase
MPRLSVVIPVYTEVRTIERIVEAVHESGVLGLEVIVVDGVRAVWCILSLVYPQIRPLSLSGEGRTRRRWERKWRRGGKARSVSALA